MKNIIATMAALCLAVPAVWAQEDAPKLKLNPTGRILMDGALFASPEKEMFKDGAAIPDIRLGVKASYGKWNAKIDVGFAGGKVGLKDVFIQYNFDSRNTLRGGSFIHQYGLQSSTSSSMKCTFEEPLSNTVFNAARQIGVMYQYNGDKYLATASAHAEPQAITLSPNQLNQQGYGLITRQLYRPVHSDGTTLQFGVSGAFLSPQTGGTDEPHDVFSFVGTFPTRVDKVTITDATIEGALNQWKFTPELLIAKGPVALEAQYFFNRVNMKHNLHSFTGQGAYATFRGLLTGGSYGYAMADGGLATPDPGQLELVVGYNYTTLSDAKAECFKGGNLVKGIYGGRVNNLSTTLNYYINKYMLVRLNYTYTYRWDASAMPNVNLNTFQARVQILF